MQQLSSSDTGEAEFLFADRPQLAEAPLAPMEPFSFAARDGLQIHGYLTFPRAGARSGLPAVLLVHGGPWTRDTWGFDPRVQWLADRGYLVIQANYRGSTGYGKAFLAAGDREWGAKMHDDLIDAVHHVVEAGYADPARVGIFGGSYGGYAALLGAAFTPTVFACAVDLCGPSNLETMIRNLPQDWQPMLPQYLTRVGDPDTEPELLWERSPLSRVENIRIPLLIAQGANDPRVKPSESDQITKALAERGTPPEYLFFEDEGHSLVKPVNRLAFYAAADRFLATHLGGRRAQSPEPS
jgi:dipeptidyl aminopeptidase/acylaminoacyl peptidase